MTRLGPGEVFLDGVPIGKAYAAIVETDGISFEGFQLRGEAQCEVLPVIYNRWHIRVYKRWHRGIRKERRTMDWLRSHRFDPNPGACGPFYRKRRTRSMKGK